MSKILSDTRLLLDALEVEIVRNYHQSAKHSRGVKGWQGPGVIFTTRLDVDAKPAPSPTARTVTVVTPHAHEAGWLLGRIQMAFAPLLGTHIEYDFFERIAEAAEEYSAGIPLEKDTATSLLSTILGEARAILAEMETGEFPHVPLETA